MNLSTTESTIAAGPVLDLQCNYDTLWELSLSCEWTEPVDSHITIQSYHVNLIHDGSVIQQMITKSLKLECQAQLDQGENYTVTVRALTHTEGEVSETHVNFMNSGKIIFSLCKVYFFKFQGTRDCILLTKPLRLRIILKWFTFLTF